MLHLSTPTSQRRGLLDHVAEPSEPGQTLVSFGGLTSCRPFEDVATGRGPLLELQWTLLGPQTCVTSTEMVTSNVNPYTIKELVADFEMGAVETVGLLIELEIMDDISCHADILRGLPPFWSQVVGIPGIHQEVALRGDDDVGTLGPGLEAKPGEPTRAHCVPLANLPRTINQ
jgi:hypothetical protein